MHAEIWYGRLPQYRHLDTPTRNEEYIQMVLSSDFTTGWEVLMAEDFIKWRVLVLIAFSIQILLPRVHRVPVINHYNPHSLSEFIAGVVKAKNCEKITFTIRKR